MHREGIAAPHSPDAGWRCHGGRYCRYRAAVLFAVQCVKSWVVMGQRFGCKIEAEEAEEANRTLPGNINRLFSQGSRNVRGCSSHLPGALVFTLLQLAGARTGCCALDRNGELRCRDSVQAILVVMISVVTLTPVVGHPVDLKHLIAPPARHQPSNLTLRRISASRLPTSFRAALCSTPTEMRVGGLKRSLSASRARQRRLRSQKLQDANSPS